MTSKTTTYGLVTNYGEGGGGGYKTGGGGACEILPQRKRGGGAENVLAMLKGGHNKFWGSFYTSFSRIEGGGAKSFHPLKGGWRKKFYPVLRGGGAKGFGNAIFSFCRPPPPPCN